jgi:transposase-like protein
MKLTQQPLPNCPSCSARDTIRNGSGRFLCRACEKTFSRRSPFPRARFPEAAIFEGVSLLEANFKTGVVLSHLKTSHKISTTRQTLFSWKKKFGPALHEYASGFSRGFLSLEDVCLQVGRDSKGLFGGRELREK